MDMEQLDSAELTDEKLEGITGGQNLDMIQNLLLTHQDNPVVLDILNAIDQNDYAEVLNKFMMLCNLNPEIVEQLYK